MASVASETYVHAKQQLRILFTCHCIALFMFPNHKRGALKVREYAVGGRNSAREIYKHTHNMYDLMTECL